MTDTDLPDEGFDDDYAGPEPKGTAISIDDITLTVGRRTS